MKALILFAHGSRDPAWQAPFLAIKKQLQTQAPNLTIACAFLELCEPDLPSVIEQFAQQGVTQIDIVPAFLARGKHIAHDLPELVKSAQQRYPQIVFITHSTWGETPAVQAAIARATLSLLQTNQ